MNGPKMLASNPKMKAVMSAAFRNNMNCGGHVKVGMNVIVKKNMKHNMKQQIPLATVTITLETH